MEEGVKLLENLIIQIRIYQNKNFGERPTHFTICYSDFVLLEKFCRYSVFYSGYSQALSVEGVIIIWSPDLQPNQIVIGKSITLQV